MKNITLALAFIMLALATGVEHARAQGTAFTYQGELTHNGGLANGIYDLRFTIYDASSGGGTLAGPITKNAVGLTNGLFTVLLDFGAGIFSGADRWVEIGARTNGGTFSTLAPRQLLTPAPYAITAANVVSGGIPTGTYASAVTFNNTSNSFNGTFTGNGAGLTGLTSSAIGSGQVVKSLNGLTDAVTLSAGANITLMPSGNSIQIAASGGGGGSGWSLTGNAGTVAGANFLGTTDNQPLELRANGARALRLEPNTNGAPNLIGGAPNNVVDAGVIGAFIGGGGTTNYSGFAYTNRVSANFGTIGGGLGNAIHTNADESAIGGGRINTILPSAFYSTISGGYFNRIQTNADRSTIGGGYFNTVFTFASESTIGGGNQNTIQSRAAASTISGGHENIIQTDADRSTIGGGANNTIASNSWFATIAGGVVNYIGTNSWSSAIGGGTNNSVAANSPDATIAGGEDNMVGSGSSSSAIGGGNTNTIAANAPYATIAGGWGNIVGASSERSTIGGGYFNTVFPFAFESTIGGGGRNTIESRAGGSTIGGGFSHLIEADAANSTIGGGDGNSIAASSPYATIGGGQVNNIGTNSSASVIGGGAFNTIMANSPYATIPGGLDNTATNFAFAAGHRAKANHRGAFVWADSQNADFASTGSNQFLIRASGNVGIGTNNPTNKLHVIGGITCTALTQTSDRNAKENFAPVSPREVLDKVAALPITTWNFKELHDGRHIGPMAQDFYAAFSFGTSDTTITSVDLDGVALAAIQALNQKLEGKDAEIQELKKAVRELKELVTPLTGERK